MIGYFNRCLSAKNKYIHTNEGGDYYIEAEGDTLYLLFECSDDREDWINNFDFLPEERSDIPISKRAFKTILDSLNLPSKPYKDMLNKWRVHGGFLKVWKSMKDDIKTYVAEFLKNHSKIKKIVVIGYSHGAALAVLATEDMEYHYGNTYKVSGYGFGTPRVLWGIVPEEVRYRLRNFTSIRNIPDIVTHLPPMTFGFRNAGTLIKIGERGKYNLFKAHLSSSYITEINAMKGENI